MFKSKSVSKGLDELVMVVTPEITMPMSPDEPKPMLDFPNEFLIPNNPVPPPPARMSSTHPAAVKQAKDVREKKDRKSKAAAKAEAAAEN